MMHRDRKTGTRHASGRPHAAGMMPGQEFLRRRDAALSRDGGATKAIAIRDYASIPRYQRSTRAPSQAPTATTSAIASEYQVTTKSGESSVQCDA